MSAFFATGDRTPAPSAVDLDQGHLDDGSTLSATLSGIDSCLRRWKASRHEGQAVLTELSNTLLLRTYMDKAGGGGGDLDARGGAEGDLWGALAHAGAAVSRVSIATEARARRLHGDLSALQDAMMAAAAGIRRHAQELRGRCCRANPAAWGASHVREPSPPTATATTVNSTSVVMGAGFAGTGPGEVAAKGALGGEEEDAEGGAGAGRAIGGGYRLMDVADAASEVAEMFFKEGLVTATVAQGVGQESNRGGREALTVYASAWMMQPYVDARRVKELEMMIGGRRRGRERG